MGEVTTWFTSDPHYGHRNIIGFSHRPFLNVDEMNAALVRRWNHVVEPTDTVYVLGDFALGPSGTIEIASQLVGHKILVAGNHDRCWFGNGPGHKLWEQHFLRAGFDEILQGVVEYDLLGTPVKLCHFPYIGDSHDSDRFIPYRPVDEGGWLLHGHIHTSWRQQDRMVNVGVDVWNYRPVADHELAELIQQCEALEDGLAEQGRLSKVMDATERRL